MFRLRRWWDRHRLQIILASLALGSAAFLRQTEGAVLYEVYKLVTSPFQPNLERKAALENAQVQELQQRLTELESQNQQLRSLVGYVGETKNTNYSTRRRSECRSLVATSYLRTRHSKWRSARFYCDGSRRSGWASRFCNPQHQSCPAVERSF